jgi:hypothetical protein
VNLGDETEEALDRNCGYEIDEKKREEEKKNEEKKNGVNLGNETEKALNRNRSYEIAVTAQLDSTSEPDLAGIEKRSTPWSTYCLNSWILLIVCPRKTERPRVGWSHY